MWGDGPDAPARAGKAKIELNEHRRERAAASRHACAMGLEGIVSARRGTVTPIDLDCGLNSAILLILDFRTHLHQARQREAAKTMNGLAIGISLVGLSLGVHVAVALADDPPELNVSTSCASAGQGIILGRDTAGCMNDEKAALDTLKKSWSQFASADKSQCVGMVKTGGPPSYVELLSCLELMKAAAEIRSSTRPGTIRDNGLRPQ